MGDATGRKGFVELRATQMTEITIMRERRRRGLPLGLVPGFYERLAAEAVPHVIEDSAGVGLPTRVLGYALLLERPHDGHSHVTVIETHLEPDQRHRFEEVLDLLREEKKPTTYLARTDDCLYDATLLSRGLQVEPTALVLLTGRSNGGGGSGGHGSHAAGQAGSSAEGDMLRENLGLLPFTARYLEDLRTLLGEDDREESHEHSHEHRHGPTTSELLAELEQMAASGRDWVLLADSSPVAVIARADGGDGVHELLDIALGMAPEADLAAALRAAARAVATEGLRPAAVIDALEATRRRVFRAAGFHTAAAYLVFYDPESGRPSVARVTTEELEALLDPPGQVRLVDVMGEEHWRAGRIPTAEWIDFRGLAREARRRFRMDEPLILYCNGFT